MKKIISIAAFIVLLSVTINSSYARRGNPASNYSPNVQFYLVDSDDNHPNAPTYKFVDTIYGTWRRITGFSNMDDGAATLTPPSDTIKMDYYGAQLRLPPRYFCTNGFVGFDTLITSANNALMPTNNFNRSMVAPLWADLEFRAYGDSSNVYYRMTTDTCYVSYYNVFLKGTNGLVRATFQIVFVKSDSSITFMYRSFDGGMCNESAAQIFQRRATIGLQNNNASMGTCYLDRGIYYATSLGSQTYAKDLHNGLAVKYMRVLNHQVKVISITTPSSYMYEMTNTTFAPTVKFENLTNDTRKVRVQCVLTNLSTGISIYNRTDSIDADPGVETSFTGSTQQGLPCGAYRLTVTTSMPSLGTDPWTQDNTIARNFVLLSSPSLPIFDDYSTIDRCTWVVLGATMDSSHLLMHFPTAPNTTGALVLDRYDESGRPYRGSGVGDTIYTAPIDLSGKSPWLQFSYQRGLKTDSSQAGILLRTLSGPEPVLRNSGGTIIRGDSLIIEAIPSTASALNPSSSAWAIIGKIYGGIDLETKKYRLQIPSTYIHNHSRFRIRLSANGDAPQYCYPYDDGDAFVIDGLQISAPALGLKNESDIEPIGIDLGAGNYTHIPRNVKNIFPRVKIASNGLSVNQAIYTVRVVIKDDLNREVYHKLQSFVAPAARTDTVVRMPVWQIEGSQGGKFKIKVTTEQCFTDYRHLNDTVNFERVLYIDDMYALDDNKPDTAGTMTAADNVFYYIFKPMVTDTLHGLECYHLAASGLTNWTISVRDMQNNPLFTRSFSYNVMNAGWNRQTFPAITLVGDTTYLIQFSMTQGTGLGGDASKGLIWQTVSNGTASTYDALFPGIDTSYRDNAGNSYFTTTTPKNAAGFGSLQPMVRLIYTGSATYLPVELLTFDARRLTNGEVSLSFRTAKEENVASYEIERLSGDEWLPVSKISAENTKTGAAYSAYDNSAPLYAVQYRLWESDLDGSRKVIGQTAVGAMPGIETFVMSVFPNPASSRMLITVRGAESGAELRVFDMTGRLIMQLPAMSDGSQEFDASSLAEGAYYIEAKNMNGSIRSKFIISR